MKIHKLIIAFVFLSLSLVVRAGEEHHSSIYGGTQVKLDIASPAIIIGMSKGQLQHYEIGVNVRLKDRFYPTLEAGYAGGKTSKDSISYTGNGAFIRLGIDINPLKKHPESPHALLVGIRFGTSAQGFDQRNSNTDAYSHTVKADCWGEIVAGCQVEIAQFPPYKRGHGERASFYMGWMGRLKFLFTRMNKELADEATNISVPRYIPGYGDRGNIGWGINYYLGWRF